MTRPNILWISLEDINPRFGCYGDPVARTPNIDRLAAQGTLYRNAFSTAAACAPSRAAIITGMYATSIGAHHMRTAHTDPDSPELPTPYEVVPPPMVKAFPEYLRMAGYFCTNNSKTDYQFASPASAWDECHTTAHWRHRRPGQPFFAVFNPMGTHESRMWKHLDRPRVTDPDALTIPPYLPDTPKVRDTLACHYDNIAASDDIVGQLLAELEADGLADNTIVVIWSDHGEGMPRAKHTLYDSGTNVPLIVRWPGHVEAGAESGRVVSMIDLGPTMLQAAGVELPPYFQGQTFLNSTATPREFAFMSRDRGGTRYDKRRAVRDQRFRYIRNYDRTAPRIYAGGYSNPHPARQELWRLYVTGELTETQQDLFRPFEPVEELYDTHEDPYEIHNLAQDPSHIATKQRLSAALDEWMAEVDDLGDIPETELVRRMWPDGEQPTTAPPIMTLLSPDGTGSTITSDTTVGEPTAVTLHSSTQGASLIYRTAPVGAEEPVDGEHWQLYTGPLPIPPDGMALWAKAVRIGYRDSRVSAVTIRTEPIAVTT